MHILEEAVDLGCKSEFARLLGVSRTCLYRHCHKQEHKDRQDINTLCAQHLKHPRYGVYRLSMQLHWSQNKTRRIRNLAGVRALITVAKPSPSTDQSEIDSADNKLRPLWQLKDPNNPRAGYSFLPLVNPSLNIWAADFTYISWHGKFLYLAANLRLSTREITGWSLGYNHDADLICYALNDALSNNCAPDIIHTDQGSEYLSAKHSNLCQTAHIALSNSDKGKPWQNGFMESFFRTFKTEMTTRLRQCQTISQVYEQIANWIYYYNNERIHTALKMSPKAFARQLQNTG